MDSNNLSFALIAMRHLSIFLLYAGPDQILPLASLLSAIIGILLIGWQRVVMFARRIFQVVTAKFQTSSRK